MSKDPRLNELFTIERLAERNEGLTKNIIRWHVFNAANNGLDESGAIVRLGRRVFIHEPTYTRWVFQHRSGSANNSERRASA